MNFDFKNKTVVITGGSSGIGKAIAVKFIESGAEVIIASHNEAQGDKACKDMPGNCTFVKTDVRKESDVKNFFEEIAKKYGKLDILVNSAGIYSPNQADITSLSFEEFNDTMETNFNGVFLTTKFGLPHLLKTKGKIINIASSLGLVPEKESTIYCASKAAVIMFTKTTALQYASQGVRINSVCPGPIDTPMLNNAFPDKKELDEYLKANPMMRAGTPEEVANLVLFLVSEDNSYITGGAYTIDGGESLK